jgi:hypothetical protein
MSQVETFGRRAGASFSLESVSDRTSPLDPDFPPLLMFSSVLNFPSFLHFLFFLFCHFPIFGPLDRFHFSPLLFLASLAFASLTLELLLPYSRFTPVSSSVFLKVSNDPDLPAFSGRPHPVRGPQPKVSFRTSYPNPWSVK